jgi:hypothetical protein
MKSHEPAFAESGGDAQCSLVALTNYTNEEARWLVSVGKHGVVEIYNAVLAFGAHAVGDG